MEKYHKPLVSVIIPCYNQAAYLPETLESLIAQTFTNWEGIIVNDGSPDNTEEIAQVYLQKDSRFKYLVKENGGLSSARNFGIAHASGEYLLPLDSDDIIKPEYLTKALLAFEEQPQLKLVYCLGFCFGVFNGPWDVAYKDYKSLLLRNSIFCSAIFRTNDCLEIGGYDEQMRQGYEDWDFFIRLLNGEKLVYQIPEHLFYYRTKEVSMATATYNVEIRAGLENYIYKKHIDKYISYFGGVLDVYRELLVSKDRIERYKNKWYRRLFFLSKSVK